MSNRKFDKNSRQWLNASTIGISMVLAIVVGTLMGVYLDKYFGTKPWLTLIFMILGIIAGFKNVFYFLKKTDIYDKNDKDNEN